MNKIFKVAIIGGGSAGLLCATELLSGENRFKGDNVVILERNDRVGKKLIATGNGQGNLSNARISSENYSGDFAFISEFIKQVNAVNPVKYLENLGILTAIDENGRIYPVSRQANSVLDIIRAYLASKDCTIKTGFKAVKITEKDGIFSVFSENGERIFAENVVLAAGGKAAKQFGTDGSAYSLATGLSHKLTPLYPSLVQLKTEKEKIKGLKGIKSFVNITLKDGSKVIKQSFGDLLFTEYGVSGNAVFQVSDKVQTLSMPILEMDFVPEIQLNELKTVLKDRERKKYIPVSDVLNGIVHKKLGETIMKTCNNDILKAAEKVKRFTLKVVGTLGFDYAQTTKGGINTEDINQKTYGSKLKRGLYIVGEMLDVDGECGGYNLTFAFVSGIMAARAIKNCL